ncbi:hypothetical protein F5890DRAFT_1550700 [Lentinula detonsa]|uniref:Uncharacterized protein n=1 Tax=Lentinula detonsa TaxID=2804962 RepID=A0AA38Q7U2_9AGAR|nr:hypothetical protein F5890DRAFT_1550700 [Lentinula detonsa]
MFTAVFAVGVAPSVFAAPVTTLTTTGFIPSSESTSQAMHIAIRDSVHFPQHGTTYSGSYPDAAGPLFLYPICVFILTTTHYGGQPPASNIEAAYMHNHILVNPQYGLHQPDPASTLTAHYVPKAAQNPVRGVRRKGMTASFTPGQQSKPHGFRRPGMNAYSG